MKNRSLLTAAALLFAAGASVSPALAAMAWPSAARVATPQNTEIVREGSGERRGKLNAVELRTMPVAAWQALSDFKNGDAVTAESVSGKPVVFITASLWTPNSQRALRTLGELAAVKDVTVVVVHDERRYEDAEKFLTDNKLAFRLAKDVGGKFRAALMSDSDPDIYIVDRAGNLRFGDIETDSAARAVEIVTAETAQAAAGRPAEVAANAKKARGERSATTEVQSVYKTDQVRKVRGIYNPPPAAEYEKLLWPIGPDKAEVTQHAQDIRGQKLKGAAAEFEGATWLTEKPDVFAGKVVILEFWATWCGPCKRAAPMLNDLAAMNRDDLLLISLSGFNDTKASVQEHLRANKSESYQALDTEKTIYEALGVQALPTAFVMSTDGLVRWIGNPNHPSFRWAVEFIIKNDPGVQVRRKADKEAFESAKKAEMNPSAKSPG